jgi:hypothetical protein
MHPQKLQELACVDITGTTRTTLIGRKAGFNLTKLGDSSDVQMKALVLERMDIASVLDSALQYSEQKYNTVKAYATENIDRGYEGL